LKAPLVTNDSVGWMFYPLVSPNQQEVAVFWNRGEEAHRGVYVISARDASQTPVGPSNSRLLAWSRDGASLYVEEEVTRRIRRISLGSGRSVLIGINPLPPGSCDLNERPAGIALICSVDESVSDVWMMENFDPADQRSR
jgi:hypothetical protein